MVRTQSMVPGGLVTPTRVSLVKVTAPLLRTTG